LQAAASSETPAPLAIDNLDRQGPLPPNTAHATCHPGMGLVSQGDEHHQIEELAMWTQFLSDEGGFIISAELVLVATICVIGLVVGLSEVQHAINAELNDVGNAIGRLNQGYFFSGFHKIDFGGIVHAATYGSIYVDTADDCDCNQCDIACDAPVPEAPKVIGFGALGGTCGGVGGTCAGF